MKNVIAETLMSGGGKSSRAASIEAAKIILALTASGHLPGPSTVESENARLRAAVAAAEAWIVDGGHCEGADNSARNVVAQLRLALHPKPDNS